MAKVKDDDLTKHGGNRTSSSKGKDDSRTAVRDRLNKMDIDILADLMSGDWEHPKPAYIDEHKIEMIVPQIGRVVVAADRTNRSGVVEYYFNSDKPDELTTHNEISGTELFAKAEEVRYTFHQNFINFVAGNDIIRDVLWHKMTSPGPKGPGFSGLC